MNGTRDCERDFIVTEETARNFLIRNDIFMFLSLMCFVHFNKKLFAPKLPFAPKPCVRPNQLLYLNIQFASEILLCHFQPGERASTLLRKSGE